MHKAFLALLILHLELGLRVFFFCIACFFSCFFCCCGSFFLALFFIDEGVDVGDEVVGLHHEGEVVGPNDVSGKLVGGKGPAVLLVKGEGTGTEVEEVGHGL